MPTNLCYLKLTINNNAPLHVIIKLVMGFHSKPIYNRKSLNYQIWLISVMELTFNQIHEQMEPTISLRAIVKNLFSCDTSAGTLLQERNKRDNNIPQVYE